MGKRGEPWGKRIRVEGLGSCKPRPTGHSPSPTPDTASWADTPPARQQEEGAVQGHTAHAGRRPGAAQAGCALLVRIRLLGLLKRVAPSSAPHEPGPGGWGQWRAPSSPSVKAPRLLSPCGRYRKHSLSSPTSRPQGRVTTWSRSSKVPSCSRLCLQITWECFNQRYRRVPSCTSESAENVSNTSTPASWPKTNPWVWGRPRTSI